MQLPYLMSCHWGAENGDEVVLATEDDSATEALEKLAALIATDLDA